MSERRVERLNELLRQAIASELFRVVNDKDFDMAAVTIARVEVSPDLRHARVYVSIMGHENDRGAMVSRLVSHRLELQKNINSTLHLKYTPRLRFILDDSIAKGDHVLSVIYEIDHEREGQK